jgi:malonyl-CoA O-methyltransferase
MTLLAPQEAYRLWASTYSTENVITHLEQRLVRNLGQSPVGLRLLDVGCGTGRRLVDTGAACAVGVDLSPEMLAAGLREFAFGPQVQLQVGDARSLPLPDGAFDLVWCRLMIGHLGECRQAYLELGRVVRAGGHVVVTDFHPCAYDAGLRRTFRHESTTHEVVHHVHRVDEQIAAAREAGLALTCRADATIGRDVRSFYMAAGKEAAYEEQRGRPMVLALAFRRDA